MAALRGMRAGGVAAVAAVVMTGALLGVSPVPAGAQSVDCDAPNLVRVEAELAVARASVVAGNRAALQAAVDSARGQLDAIAAACWGPGSSPAPSLPPVELGGSGTIGERPFAYPADLVEVEDGLMRPVEQGDLRADAITLADSSGSGELLRSDLRAPVPAGFRVLSLAAGDPVATLAAVGVTDTDAAVPDDPVAALRLLVAAAEASASNGDVVIAFGDVRAFTFPGGTDGSDGSAAGAAVDLTIVNAEGATLATGTFILRPLPDGEWALGVAFAAPDGLPRLSAELAATLRSIKPAP